MGSDGGLELGWIWERTDHEYDWDSDDEDKDNLRIDEHVCKMLLNGTKPSPCVFHRAFDSIAVACRSPEGAELVLRLGFEGVLTAGGHGGTCCKQDNFYEIDHICHRHAFALT
ncbi:hypothetical protein CDD80_7565 [Ophiocordyceps camponoti-rufipedis]|uniref:Uncharacterized protein n=1 Tax=Ophiocordyceps camponoti-rufipedis TaxID=2004952 RepID=A0A2C5ZDZ8_9HYPO|nr:hypothetical protein CDD80_7565 [Ophiocordyceps camponoti-rufipedis]